MVGKVDNISVVGAGRLGRKTLGPAAILRSEADRWDGMAITNRAFKLMRDWVDGPIAEEYSLSSDWDDRWRTGGTVDEVIEEAHLSQEWLIKGIQKFVKERDQRLSTIEKQLNTQLGAVTVKAVADTADTVHVVIPYAAAEGELSDADLERVAGGKQDITANCLVLGGTAVSNTVMQLNL